jgi:hypothetical protein
MTVISERHSDSRYRVRSSDEIGAATHPYAFECPNYQCFWATAHSSAEDALAAIEIHDKRCPMGEVVNAFVPGEVDENGQPYTKPKIGKSIAEKVWDMLDEAIYEVLNQPSDANKARGRALAEVLHLICMPYYDTVNDVTREAVRRAKQKDGLVEFQATPGYKYNPMPPNKYEALLAAKKAEQKAAVYDPTAVLTDDQKIAITNGLRANFSVDQLSKAYGVSPSVIKALAEKPIEA